MNTNRTTATLLRFLFSLALLASIVSLPRVSRAQNSNEQLSNSSHLETSQRTSLSRIQKREHRNEY